MTLASGFADDGDALPIRADARVLGATLKAGESVDAHGRRGAPRLSRARDRRDRDRRRALRRPRRRGAGGRPDRDDHGARGCRDRPGRRRLTRLPPERRELPPGRAGTAHPNSSRKREGTRRRMPMTKVLVLYYSSYGHIEQMADAVAEGARAGGRRGRHPPRARNRAGRRSSRRRTSRPTPRIPMIEAPTRWRTMTRSSSVRRPASAGCRARWRRSGITTGGLWVQRRAERQGRRCVHLDRDASMAGRRRRCSRSSPTCCTSA